MGAHRSKCIRALLCCAGGEQADGMISIIAHEIVEVITDPDANAW